MLAFFFCYLAASRFPHGNARSAIFNPHGIDKESVDPFHTNEPGLNWPFLIRTSTLYCFSGETFWLRKEGGVLLCDRELALPC